MNIVDSIQIVEEIGRFIDCLGGDVCRSLLGG